MLVLFLASFTTGLPTSIQIKRLNRNSNVPLSNDIITIEKVRINIVTNPHTLFLVPSNTTVDTINKYVTEVLFENHSPIAEVINSLKVPMKLYKHMTVITVENSYNGISTYLYSLV